MGDPRKIRAKYSGPTHPWQRARIEEEKLIIIEFGLKNKKEIWKSTSKLRAFKTQAKKLVTKEPTQRALEEKQLLERLIRLGLVGKDATREKVLELTNQDLLGRRLQTVVHKKGLARTIKQARQLIAHGHVFVNGKKIDVPSYLVTLDDEGKIKYSPSSDFNDDMHPEKQRIIAKEEPKPVEAPKVEEKELVPGDKEVKEIEKALEKAEAEKEVEIKEPEQAPIEAPEAPKPEESKVKAEENK